MNESDEFLYTKLRSLTHDQLIQFAFDVIRYSDALTLQLQEQHQQINELTRKRKEAKLPRF